MGTYAKAFFLTFRCGHVASRYLKLSHKEVARRIRNASLVDCHACQFTAEREARLSSAKYQDFHRRIMAFLEEP